MRFFSEHIQTSTHLGGWKLPSITFCLFLTKMISILKIVCSNHGSFHLNPYLPFNYYLPIRVSFTKSKYSHWPIFFLISLSVKYCVILALAMSWNVLFYAYIIFNLQRLKELSTLALCKEQQAVSLGWAQNWAIHINPLGKKGLGYWADVVECFFFWFAVECWLLLLSSLVLLHFNSHLLRHWRKNK